MSQMRGGTEVTTFSMPKGSSWRTEGDLKGAGDGENEGDARGEETEARDDHLKGAYVRWVSL